MTDRCAPPPDDRSPISRVEIDFAIPVWLTGDQERRLHSLLSEISDAPCNSPTAGVHWLAGWGARPRYSRADARFLGVEMDPDAPESGEPTFDDEVLHGETVAREFGGDEERERVTKRRRKAKEAAEITALHREQDRYRDG